MLAKFSGTRGLGQMVERTDPVLSEMFEILLQSEENQGSLLS